MIRRLMTGYADSEFKSFLDTLKDLGISFCINWGATKEEWQSIIDQSGYCITALACVVVLIGKEEFLFASGPVDWDDHENGYGPRGLFMLSRNQETGKITNRVFFDSSGNPDKSWMGLAAVKKQYASLRWSKP